MSVYLLFLMLHIIHHHNIIYLSCPAFTITFYLSFFSNAIKGIEEKNKWYQSERRIKEKPMVSSLSQDLISSTN